MKRKITRFIVLLIFILNIIVAIPSNTVIAYGNTIDTATSIETKDFELDGLYDYINNMKSDIELMNDLDPLNYVETYLKSGEGNISFQKVLKAIVSLFFKEVKTVLGLAFSILVIGIISALLKNLQDAFSSASISEIAFYACYGLLIIILAKSFLVSIDLARNVITTMVGFMGKLLPVLVVMLGAAGGITQAATLDPIILGATVIIPNIYINFIIPLILMSFVLQFANNFSNGTKLSNFCSMFKKSLIWMQGIILTIFIGILTVRGITASTIDAVTLKTTKFAVDNFIPIVGKSFSDAITSVAGYSLLIKNAVGSLGLISIIIIIIYPIVKIIMSSVIFKITAALLEPITDKRITSSISAASESLTFIMTSVLCVSLMFFILIAMIIQAGKFVVGG